MYNIPEGLDQHSRMVYEAIGELGIATLPVLTARLQKRSRVFSRTKVAYHIQKLRKGGYITKEARGQWRLPNGCVNAADNHRAKLEESRQAELEAAAATAHHLRHIVRYTLADALACKPMPSRRVLLDFRMYDTVDTLRAAIRNAQSNVVAITFAPGLTAKAHRIVTRECRRKGIVPIWRSPPNNQPIDERWSL